MKTLKILCFLILFAGIANAGTVKIGITHDLIQSTPQIWNLVKEDIPEPLIVSGIVGRNASHEVWQSVIDNAEYVHGAVLYSPVLPWSVVSSARVPDGWFGAWLPPDENGNPTTRKRFWQFTESYLSPDGTEFIMRLNGPMENMEIVDGRLTSGNYITYKEGDVIVKTGSCPDDLLKKFIALMQIAVPGSDGFLTFHEGQAIIQSWGISE